MDLVRSWRPEQDNTSPRGSCRKQRNQLDPSCLPGADVLTALQGGQLTYVDKTKNGSRSFVLDHEIEPQKPEVWSSVMVAWDRL